MSYLSSQSSSFWLYYMLMTSSLRHYDVIFMTYFKMDFNRVFSQAISRTVNKCYAEESEISVAPFLHWSFNPLIPPGCIPFLELAGLESGNFSTSGRNLKTGSSISDPDCIFDSR